MDEKPEIIICVPTGDDEQAGNLGIHEDYIEAFSKGEPFGVDVIDLPNQPQLNKGNNR